MQSDDSPPFLVIEPSPPGPLVFASPHSGRCYPPEFLAMTRLPLASLRRSEDSFVDELVAGVPAHGAALIAARFPRAFCDVNREAWELDPSMFEGALPPWVNTSSARVRAGLGTIARVVGGGEALYAERLPFAEAERRVRLYWRRYHDALASLVRTARAQAGFCLLIDCHSMPAQACDDRRPVPDVVLGDVHGASCAPALTRAVERFFIGRGYAVRRNDPYAGGYVTRHYGQPRAAVHGLQIELARALYMDERLQQREPGLARVREDLTALAALLASEATTLTGET